MLHINVATIFEFIWEKDMSVEEFVVVFHSSIGEISRLNMNDELKGHILLRQTNLDSHDRHFIIGSTWGNTRSKH